MQRFLNKMDFHLQALEAIAGLAKTHRRRQPAITACCSAGIMFASPTHASDIIAFGAGRKGICSRKY